MRKRLIALSVVGFILQSTVIGFAQGEQGVRGTQQSPAVQKARTAVAKASSKTKVTVTLTDHTKVKGFILNAGNDCFTLVDPKTNNANCIDYTNVLRVQRQRRSSWIDWVSLGAAVGVPIVIVGVALRSDQ